MAKKGQILNNLNQYSITEISHAIKSGEITMYELSKSGMLTPLMRQRIEDELRSPACVGIQMANLEDLPTSNGSADVQKSSVVADVKPQAPLVNEVTGQQASVISVEQRAPISSSTLEKTKKINPKVYGEIIDNRGMFLHPFSFKGRIRRLEYGLAYIIYMILYAIFTAMLEEGGDHPVILVLAIVLFIGSSWFFRQNQPNVVMIEVTPVGIS